MIYYNIYIYIYVAIFRKENMNIFHSIIIETKNVKIHSYVRDYGIMLPRNVCSRSFSVYILFRCLSTVFVNYRWLHDVLLLSFGCCARSLLAPYLIHYGSSITRKKFSKLTRSFSLLARVPPPLRRLPIVEPPSLRNIINSPLAKD